MDFLRMEGELNFLVLLPEKARRSTAEYWYRGAPKDVTDYVYGRDAHFNRPSGLTYRTSDPQRELYEMLSARWPRSRRSDSNFHRWRIPRCGATCRRCRTCAARASPGCRR